MAWFGLLGIAPACAVTSTFQTYSTDAGFTSVGGRCLLQDGAGYLLACSEVGVLAYNGRRFANLDTDRGLRRGGTVYGLVLTSTARLAVGYGDDVYVADQPSTTLRPPTSLSFRRVEHPGLPFYSERIHRIAPWRDGLVVIAGGDLARIAVPKVGPASLMMIDYTPSEHSALHGAVAVFSVHDRLWASFEDGRICLADPGHVVCYDRTNGLPPGRWFDMVAGTGDQVLARSATAVATIQPALRRASAVTLPDQQTGRYANVQGQLSLFRAPDGRLMTQADHGLAVLGPSGWHLLTVQDGAPAGTIASAMTDASGQLWLQVFGQGLVHWVGYGHWQAVTKADGLSDGVPWTMTRPLGGSLWVATDTGIDEIVQRDGDVRVGRVIPGTSFILAAGPHGRLWSSFGNDGARVIDLVTGAAVVLKVPDVDAIVADERDMVWIGTQQGLFEASGTDPVPKPVRVGTRQDQVTAIVADGDGGIFYLANGELRHHHRDATDVRVTGPWPATGFHAIETVLDHHGRWWVIGDNVFFSFDLSGDRTANIREVPRGDVLSDNIAALMVDHRGWVWAAGNAGISVYDGHRWVNADSDNGLLFNDTMQNGLWEDPDGSVWISTSHGVSHLTDPASLFVDRPLDVVIADAKVGDAPLQGQTVPFSQEALSLQLGTPDFAAQRSLLFRYQLSGVDARWVTSSSGLVRYPFVPPGRHFFSVTAHDQLSNRDSPPSDLVIKMAWPWWRQWWFVIAAFITVSSVILGGLALMLRWRDRTFHKREAELEELVKQRTAELEFLATHDALTGLMTRSESERRLASQLSAKVQPGELLVALLDIDHFKRINDQYGHIGGDDVLRAVGALVLEQVAAGEYAGRYGGEEVLIVLEDHDGRAADRILELHAVFGQNAFVADGERIGVTCSIGLAWSMQEDTWESLLRRADQALYKAKSDGRNRVIECDESGLREDRAGRQGRDLHLRTGHG